MKKILLATVGLIALGVGSASAADIQRRAAMPAKAPMMMPLYNWTGPYIGISGGGGWGRSDISAPLASGTINTSGGLVGGTLGYNYQMNQIVLGLEGDGSWSGIGGSGTCTGGLACSVRNNWLATARGRLGFAWDRFMPYVTGGAAFGDIRSSVATFADSTSTKTGWTAGGGIEAAIAGPWTAKVEYLYVDLGRGASIGGADTGFNTNIVRAGLNYRF
jgi:outer membrane immunogenic protein